MENILRDINAQRQGDTLTSMSQLEEMRRIEEKMKQDLENMMKAEAQQNQAQAQAQSQGSVQVVETKKQSGASVMFILTLIISIVILYYAYKYFNMDIRKYPMFANVSAVVLTLSAFMNLFYSFYMLFLF
jgi:predicted PurR-regulated permease PerM